jgi:hypothetical protein
MSQFALCPEPVNGLLTVGAAFTPTSNIHDPESTYSRYYWPSTTGPTGYLAWIQLVAWLPNNDDTTIAINHAEFAHALGTSPARLTNALGRLIAFHLAYTIPAQPATLFIKRRAPTLNPKQLAHLAQRCPTLAASHDEQLAA